MCYSSRREKAYGEIINRLEFLHIKWLESLYLKKVAELESASPEEPQRRDNQRRKTGRMIVECPIQWHGLTKHGVKNDTALGPTEFNNTYQLRKSTVSFYYKNLFGGYYVYQELCNNQEALTMKLNLFKGHVADFEKYVEQIVFKAKKDRDG